jgi:WD40 repeat protein
MLKYEYRPLSGAIRDLAWTEDSKRIAVCGEGSEVMARAFLWDSGSSVGEITGHSKRINSIDIKQTRPYRIVTGSEDTDVGFYAGPPFKFSHLNHEHSRFVNAVRFSPDGNLVLSGGADSKVCNGFFGGFFSSSSIDSF